MRTALAALLCSLPAGAASLELEVAPGYVSSDASSPVLRARAGVNLDWFTPSIALFTAMFQDPGLPEETGQSEGGLRAWGVAAQARFHTIGTHQLVGGLGIGWGQLIALQPENGYYGYRGQPAPYVQFFFGYRAEIGSARLGFELTVDGFNRVNSLSVDDPFAPPCAGTPAGCPTHSTIWMAGLALTLAFAFPR